MREIRDFWKIFKFVKRTSLVIGFTQLATIK